MTPDADYQLKKSFVLVVADEFMKLDRVAAEHRPAQQIEQLEQRSKRLARTGVDQAFNDCMEMLQGLDSVSVNRLNRRLQELNLPSLGDVQRLFSKKYAAVLKRGRIRTETEFYLLRNVLDAPQTSPADREKVALLLEAYEFGRQ